MYGLLKMVAAEIPDDMPGHVVLRAVKMLEAGLTPKTVAGDLAAMQKCWRQPAHPDRKCFCGDPVHQRHVALCRRLCANPTNPDPKAIAEATRTLWTPEYMNPLQIELCLELGTLVCIFTGGPRATEVLEALVQFARETLVAGHVLSRRMARALKSMQEEASRPQFSVN